MSFEKNMFWYKLKQKVLEKVLFFGFSSFSSTGGLGTHFGVHFLTPLYVLIATNFAVATCISEFAFYRRFFDFWIAKKGPKKSVKMPFLLFKTHILVSLKPIFT